MKIGTVVIFMAIDCISFNIREPINAHIKFIYQNRKSKDEIMTFEFTMISINFLKYALENWKQFNIDRIKKLNLQDNVT